MNKLFQNYKLKYIMKRIIGRTPISLLNFKTSMPCQTTSVSRIKVKILADTKAMMS